MEFRSDLKRFRNSGFQEVGAELLQWFKFSCDQNLEGITKLPLLEKARSIERSRDSLKINIGWVKRWKNHMCPKYV